MVSGFLPCKEVLSSALDGVSCGVVVWDTEGEDIPILYVNGVFAQMLSAKPADLLGKSVTDVFSQYCQGENLQEKIEESGDDVELEKTQEESSLWYRLEMIPMEENDGLVLGILKDETEFKLRQTKIFQSQKLESLGQLAGGVAHDFNNILSIIDGYARMTKKEVSGRRGTEEYLDKIMDAVKRGASLTQQLLTFGRRSIVVESVTDVGEFVREHEGLLKPLLDASIQLKINAEQGIAVSCAPDIIGQILINLVVNARDAMPKGGLLQVDVFSSEGEGAGFAVLRVRDTGTGMDEETKDKIFDPFFTTKDQGKGTGLGLSTVYGLVKQMKGNIEVESAEGEGTEIMVSLPLSDKQPVKKIVNVPASEAGQIRLDGYTALVAEDEPDLLALVAGMLKEMGMRVLTASNGNEALLRQEDFGGQIDFLVTDIVMPELSGVRLAELFESVRPDTKTIFMSGYPAGGQMARIEIPDGAYFLPKPVDYDKLAHTLVCLSDAAEQSHLHRMAGRFSGDGGSVH